MLFKKKKKRNSYGRTKAEQKEFNRLNDEFFAALAKLPPDWREVAEGRAKLPPKMVLYHLLDEKPPILDNGCLCAKWTPHLCSRKRLADRLVGLG